MVVAARYKTQQQRRRSSSGPGRSYPAATTIATGRKRTRSTTASSTWPRLSTTMMGLHTVCILLAVAGCCIEIRDNTVLASPIFAKPRRARDAIMQSIPALSVYHRVVNDDPRGRSSRGGTLLDCHDDDDDENVVGVAVKQKAKADDDDEEEQKRRRQRRKQRKRRIKKISKTIKSSLPPIKDGGFYYGLTPKELKDGQTHHRPKQPRLQDTISEAVEELRSLREDIERMRREIKNMRVKILGEEEMDDDEERGSGSDNAGETLWQRREKQRQADKLAAQIEAWAHMMLQESEDDGWKRIECSKVVRSSVNASNRTVAYVKWMKDSREDQADADDEDLYPCMKCYATIDAPLEAVCSYLAEEAVSSDYNDVVKRHHDIEELSPNAKICWSQSPQILFIKPRDFVTFCHHRWTKDGTEVIVNQAFDHPAAKPSESSVRGYALRGANFISRCREDPSKTQITIIAHANPGGGLPPWASKTAVNALAPIEPFKLFHKINEQVQKNQLELGERFRRAEMVSSVPPGRSRRPGGMAQLGYACFWPNGGGSVEIDGKFDDDDDDDNDESSISHTEEVDDEFSPSEQA